MKLKSIFAALVATIAVATGCQKEVTVHQLDTVKVESSYLSIPMNGGSATLNFEAKDNWEFDKVPAWLEASAYSGVAGSNTILLSAASTLDGRTAEFVIKCGADVQNISVIQGLSVVAPATCKEVLAGPDSKTYRVTGICTAIANTTYGNWYINDGTGEVYIYGTLDKKGAEKNFLSLGIEVGDEITVEGPKTTYGTTVELVNVTVININKSLIKAESILYDDDPELDKAPVEGGDIAVALSCKGQGVFVDVPADAKDWLSISAIAGDVVVFHAAENKLGARSTVVTFNTTDGKKTYSCEVTIAQAGGIVDCTVAEFLAAPEGEGLYRITGVVTSVANVDYGNIYIADATGEFYVYGVGAKGDFAKTGVEAGDVVTVVGKRAAYKGNPQMTGCEGFDHVIYVEPISLADFRALPDSKENYYMISGKVAESTEEGTKFDLETYGNFALTDGKTEVYVYGVRTGWNGAKGQFGTLGIKKDDILTIICYKTSYKGLIEADGCVFFNVIPADE